MRSKDTCQPRHGLGRVTVNDERENAWQRRMPAYQPMALPFAVLQTGMPAVGTKRT
jgi:hypothetical protein